MELIGFFAAKGGCICRCIFCLMVISFSHQVLNGVIFIYKKGVFKYYEDGILRAFTLVRFYDNAPSLTGLQFCWDYHKPQIALGKYSMIKELEYARDNE